MSIWSNIKTRLLGFAIAQDEALNAVIGPDKVPAAGNPHYTVSQRLAEMRNNGSKIGCYGCKALTWVQNKIFRIPGDHCSGSLDGFPTSLPSDG